MIGYLHRISDHLWRLGRAALVALLFLHVFAGPSVFAAWSLADDACAEGPCPCEALGDEAGHGHDEEPCADEGAGEPCPDEESGEPCPLTCDGCSCCPGVALAVVPAAPVVSTSACAGASLGAPRDADPSGVTGRLFKPPRSPSD